MTQMVIISLYTGKEPNCYYEFVHIYRAQYQGPKWLLSGCTHIRNQLVIINLYTLIAHSDDDPNGYY